MTRRSTRRRVGGRAGLFATLALACHPSSEPVAEGGAAISVEPGGEQPGEEGGDEQTGKTSEAPTPERDPAPPPDATTCELICADVYACVLEDDPDRLAATTIELGCLDGCVRARESFAACERPGPGAASCVDYLACARRAWPRDDRPSTVVEPPPDGCRLGCHAFARCEGKPIEAGEACARMCREALDEDLQRVAASCAEYEDCGAIARCMTSLPGA